MREAEAAFHEAPVDHRYAKIEVDCFDEPKRGGATSEQTRGVARWPYERSPAEAPRTV